jgi:hypothetical protein
MTVADVDTSAFPVIKFFKDAVEEIMSGRKTIEPRPRSAAWIKKLQGATHARLTYGPMMGAQTVFAVARIDSVEIRGFDSATRADVDRIGHDWPDRSVKDFVTTYTEWFDDKLAKGYEVAWITFTVVPELSP